MGYINISANFINTASILTNVIDLFWFLEIIPSLWQYLFMEKRNLELEILENTFWWQSQLGLNSRFGSPKSTPLVVTPWLYSIDLYEVNRDIFITVVWYWGIYLPHFWTKFWNQISLSKRSSIRYKLYVSRTFRLFRKINYSISHHDSAPLKSR